MNILWNQKIEASSIRKIIIWMYYKLYIWLSYFCYLLCWISLKIILFSSWVSMETRSMQYSLHRFLPSNQSTLRLAYWGTWPVKK